MQLAGLVYELFHSSLVRLGQDPLQGILESSDVVDVFPEFFFLFQVVLTSLLLYLMLLQCDNMR